MTGPALPSPGHDGGRMRNTFANVLSKNQVNYQNPGGAQALPSLDPASTANYYSQLAGLYAGYQNQLVALKQQRVGARAGFKAERAAIQAEKLTGLADAENAAIERGMLGGTADLQARTGVRAQAASAVAGAKSAMLQEVAQTRIGAQQAGIDYFMQSQGLEAQKLAQQQALLSDQLMQNLIISGQETQMDAMKGIYEALAGIGQGGGGGNTQGPGAGRRGPNPTQLARRWGLPPGSQVLPDGTIATGVGGNVRR